MQDADTDTLKPPLTTGVKEYTNQADLPDLGRLVVENNNITLDMRVADSSRPEGAFNIRSIDRRQTPILDDKGRVVGQETTTDIQVVDNSSGKPVIYWLSQKEEKRPGAASITVARADSALPFKVYSYSPGDKTAQPVATKYGDVNLGNGSDVPEGLKQRGAEVLNAANLADRYLNRVTAAMLGDDNFSNEAKAGFSQFQAKTVADLDSLRQAQTTHVFPSSRR